MIGFLTISAVAVAWMGHTDQSRRYAARFVLACRDAGLSEKQAAITMGLTGSQLSRQLAGQEPLSAYRVQALPEAFHEAMASREAKARGWELLTPAQLTLLRGAAVLGRRMLKMLPVESSAQKAAG